MQNFKAFSSDFDGKPGNHRKARLPHGHFDSTNRVAWMNSCMFAYAKFPPSQNNVVFWARVSECF